MRLRTRYGDLAFKQFTFPDGQRHFELQTWDLDSPVTIETAIRNGDELLDVLLAADALQMRGATVSLDIRYLLAARMDRRIGIAHPFTLQVVARVLNSVGFRRIRILDPHSPIALALLGAEAVLPIHAAACVLAHYDPERTIIIAPDAGAATRTRDLVHRATDATFYVAQGMKRRDPQTGALGDFSIGLTSAGVSGQTCLIVDDLCDGGATFSGIAAVLQRRGAAAVDLFVTHGIFSKGGMLPGIRTIYTTNSYHGLDTLPAGPIVLKVDMDRADVAPKDRKETLA